jgi:hypothetical protein
MKAHIEYHPLFRVEHAIQVPCLCGIGHNHTYAESVATFGEELIAA